MEGKVALRRIINDIFSRFLGMLISVADRIILAGLMLRCWGVDSFALWSLALSVIALLNMLDAGCLTSFSNRQEHWTLEKQSELAPKTYWQSNLVFVLLSALLLLLGLAIALLPALQQMIGIDEAKGEPSQLLFIFALINAIKMVSNPRTNLMLVDNKDGRDYVSFLKIALSVD